jgi:hypothetical protein
MAGIRIIAKTLLAVILTVIILPVLLAVALYIPPIQQWAVQKAAYYASDATGMDITLRRLLIKFPLDLDLEHLVVIQEGDTLVAVEEAVADFNLSQALDWRLGVNSLELNHGLVNIVQKPDTTEKDTSKTELPPLIADIKYVNFNDVRATFRTAGDTLSVAAFLRNATLSGGNVALGPSIYRVENFEATMDSLSVTTLDSLGTQHSLFPPDLQPLTYALTPFTLKLSSLFLQLPSCNFSVDELKLITPSLNAVIKASGNLEHVSVDSLHLWIPDELDIRTRGEASNLSDIDSLCARFDWDIKAHNLSSVKRYLGLTGINLPPMTLNAYTTIDGNHYHADAILNEGRGNVRLKGYFDASSESYEAIARINGINVRDFLPRDSIGTIFLTANVKGTGTDIYSPSTSISASVDLQSLKYGSWLIDKVNALASLRAGKAQANLLSCNKLLEANIVASARIFKNRVDNFTLDAQVDRADMNALRITSDTLSVAGALTATGASNFKDTHSLHAFVENVSLITPDSTFHPFPVLVEGQLKRDSIYAHVESGDLFLRFTSSDGLDRILKKVDNVNHYLREQMDASIRDHEPFTLSHDSLKTLLPSLALDFRSKRDNTFADIVNHIGYNFEDVYLRLASDPVRGLNGDGYMYGFQKGNVRLDTLTLGLSHDSRGFNVIAQLINGPKNPTATFSSTFKASLQPSAIEAAVDFIDSRGNKGVDLGVRLEGEDSTLMAHITPKNPILAYRTFTVNDGNYLSIDRSKHIQADFNLLADDGTQIMLSSPEENNNDVLQDLTLSIRHLNLGELCSVLPFVMPKVSGMLDGDVHALVVDTTEATVAVELSARDLVYEQAPLGNVGVNAVWFPNPDGTQVVDGQLTQNGREVLLLNGSYWTDRTTDEDNIRATATLQRLPLLLANGFIPGDILRLDGYAVGALSVEGPLSALRLNGTLATDSMDIKSIPYSVHLALPADTLHINDSQLEFKNIRAFSVSETKNSRPDLDVEHALVLNGTVNFQNLDDIKLNMSAFANNFRLINAPKSKKAQAYGKAYVDAAIVIVGNLQNLRVGGKLKLLGNTDLTYVVTDTPLSADNQLDGLVTFCDFSDTTTVVVEEKAPMDIRLNLILAIDEAATVHALLSEDGNDHVEIEGGGELNFSYHPIAGNRLYGRYTILSGKLDYSLVVASLKDFKLHSGSYIEFTGDPLNPTLSLSASERKKANVSEGKGSRTVLFDVGLKVTRNLKDLGLEFTIEAPEDLSCQQEIQAMSKEQRGRVAVTLLATGMYISDSRQASGGGFAANDALNSFLQSQINNVAGKALKTVDIGFGMDNVTNETGATHTDYNFSFAKRFWGNRISVIVGGKVSSGNNVQNTGESIINNISVEYRLDKSGTRYVRAFYDRDYESLMEGTITKMGGGIIFRRKTATLGELFLFRKKQ